jgi:hypothetical protein
VVKRWRPGEVARERGDLVRHEIQQQAFGEDRDAFRASPEPREEAAPRILVR